jgi:hypothetical protein
MKICNPWGVFSLLPRVMMPNPHQMSIIPSRDYISEFVAFLAKTPGRDKLCRTIQFSAKIMKYLEETKLADPKKPSVHFT